MGKRKLFVERTEGDDILDALSMRVNETLKTEKKIDDKKNNVYFWLFKFLILIVFIVAVNVLITLVENVAIDLIYYFSVSLRSIFSLGTTVVLEFSRWFITLYLLYKNLSIFMSSTYYNRLYSKDKEMNAKKKKFFGVTLAILKCLAVPLMVFAAFVSAVSLAFLTMFIYLAIHGFYSVSAILIVLVVFGICYSVFRNMQYKFFNRGKSVRKQTFAMMLILLLFSLVLFSYEVGGYEYSSSLPKNFTTEEKMLYFDIESRNEVVFKTGSKYDNMNIYVDNTLNDQVRVELEYFETADVRYTYYFNENDDLNIRFDSDISFDLADFESVLKLGVETLRNQTLYNYNLFKYPTINIYVSNEDIEKITLLDYDNDKEVFTEE